VTDFCIASDDPKHWRERAEKARYVADGMTDPVLKQMMLDVAAGYERLAKRAEDRRLARKPLRSK
jgi:hypothetical protein